MRGRHHDRPERYRQPGRPELTQGYREHLAEDAGLEIIAVPGRVSGSDIEGQADALADDAACLASLLAALAQGTVSGAMDVIAVFRGLSRVAGVDGGRGRRVAPPGMVRP